MQRRVMVIVSVVVLLLAGGVSSVAAAPPQPADCSTPTYNLIRTKNCGIESTVPDTNWEASQSYITIERSTEQVHNGSYSIKVTGTSSFPINSSQGAQTVKTSNPIPVTPSTGYSFVAWVYIPSTATRVNAARLRVGWYNAADCSGSQLTTHTADITAVDTWTYGWLYATSPSNANCAQLRLYIQTPTTGSGAVGPVYFDNVMFYPSNATAVTLSSLTASAPAAPLVALVLPVFGLAAAGIAVYRRRSR